MVITCTLYAINSAYPHTEIIPSNHVLEILVFQMSVISTWEVVARRRRVERIVETLHYGESFFTVEKVILRPFRVYLLIFLCQESHHHQALHDGGGQGQVQGGEVEGDH